MFSLGIIKEKFLIMAENHPKPKKTNAWFLKLRFKLKLCLSFKL